MPSQLSPKLLLAGLGLLLVVVVAISFSKQNDQAATDGPYLEDVTEASDEPTAENVDPTFHARVMALEQEIEGAPGDTSLLLELAHLRQDAHQLEEAVSAYRRVLEVVPNHRQSQLDLALCYGELAQWDDALETTENLLRQFPNDPSGLYNLGAIHANLQNYPAAAEAWQQVASQTTDVEMAQLASLSLTQLATPSANPSPGPIDPASPLPAGHPEIPRE